MKKDIFTENINPIFLSGIAHRGLHDDSKTENGLKAFEAAINKGIAFEFDVHLTKDNHLVVCHDEDLKRTTNKEGIIEHLTLKDIKENYRLLDGGEIPTLEEVLSLNNERVPMAIELKVFEKNYKPLAARVKQSLEVVKDKKNVMLISFDPRSLWPFKKSGFIRSLLVAKSDEYTWFFRRSVESVDLEKVLFKENRVKRYSKKHFTNVWVVKSEDDIKEVIDYVDTVTFENIDPSIIKNALDSKRR